jgi:hypothetical protein
MLLAHLGNIERRCPGAGMAGVGQPSLQEAEHARLDFAIQGAQYVSHIRYLGIWQLSYVNTTLTGPNVRVRSLESFGRPYHVSGRCSERGDVHGGGLPSRSNGSSFPLAMAA